MPVLTVYLYETSGLLLSKAMEEQQAIPFYVHQQSAPFTRHAHGSVSLLQVKHRLVCFEFEKIILRMFFDAQSHVLQPGHTLTVFDGGVETSFVTRVWATLG